MIPLWQLLALLTIIGGAYALGFRDGREIGRIEERHQLPEGNAHEQ